METNPHLLTSLVLRVLCSIVIALHCSCFKTQKQTVSCPERSLWLSYPAEAVAYNLYIYIHIYIYIYINHKPSHRLAQSLQAPCGDANSSDCGDSHHSRLKQHRQHGGGLSTTPETRGRPQAAPASNSHRCVLRPERGTAIGMRRMCRA